MTSMIDRACMAAWPDCEAVTDEMRSRMRAAIAATAMREEISWLKSERDHLLQKYLKLRAALEWYAKELPMSSGDIAREVLAGKMPEELEGK